MNKFFCAIVAVFMLLATACSSHDVFIHNDRTISGLIGPIKEMVKVDFEAAESDSGLVALYPDAMFQTACLYNEAGVLLEQTNRAAGRVSDEQEYMIVSLLNDLGQVVEQEGGKYGQQGYFKYFNEYDEVGRISRQVRFNEDLEIRWTYDVHSHEVFSIARHLVTEERVWEMRSTRAEDGSLLSELFVDNKGNKISELKQEFDNNRRLRSRLVGYWEAGSWVQEFTEYAYDSDGRLASEKTGYVGTDFYVITTYSDYDPWGNWRRSEIRDQDGLPYTFSLRRFSYFD